MRWWRRKSRQSKEFFLRPNNSLRSLYLVLWSVIGKEYIQNKQKECDRIHRLWLPWLRGLKLVLIVQIYIQIWRKVYFKLTMAMHGLLLQLLIIRSKKYENKKVKIRKIELHLTRFISKYVGFWGYRKWFRKRNFGIFLHCLDGSLRSVWSRGPIIAGNGLETWQSFSLYVLLTILGVDFIESVRDNS